MLFFILQRSCFTFSSYGDHISLPLSLRLIMASSILSLSLSPLTSPTPPAPTSNLRRSIRCSVGPEQACCSSSGSDGAFVVEERLQSGGGAGVGLGFCRREVLVPAVCAVVAVFGYGGGALARDRRNKKEIRAEDYRTSTDGLKFYDVQPGNGPIAEMGETVSVHFDCVYRSITAVSSRESKILAGNRTIAQPYEFIVGATPGKERKREFVDSANGLFSAQASPKPPPALYTVTEGMRVGGKRTVIVPPEAGYGNRGLNEIPPDATFEMNVELLEVKTSSESSSK